MPISFKYIVSYSRLVVFHYFNRNYTGSWFNSISLYLSGFIPDVEASLDSEKEENVYFVFPAF